MLIRGGLGLGWTSLIGGEWGVEFGGITFGCVYAEGKGFLVQNVWGESLVDGSKITCSFGMEAD